MIKTKYGANSLSLFVHLGQWVHYCSISQTGKLWAYSRNLVRKDSGGCLYRRIFFTFSFALFKENCTMTRLHKTTFLDFLIWVISSSISVNVSEFFYRHEHDTEMCFFWFLALYILYHLPKINLSRLTNTCSDYFSTHSSAEPGLLKKLSWFLRWVFCRGDFFPLKMPTISVNAFQDGLFSKSCCKCLKYSCDSIKRGIHDSRQEKHLVMCNWKCQSCGH